MRNPDGYAEILVEVKRHEFIVVSLVLKVCLAVLGMINHSAVLRVLHRWDIFIPPYSFVELLIASMRELRDKSLRGD